MQVESALQCGARTRRRDTERVTRPVRALLAAARDVHGPEQRQQPREAIAYFGPLELVSSDEREQRLVRGLELREPGDQGAWALIGSRLARSGRQRIIRDPDRLAAHIPPRWPMGGS